MNKKYVCADSIEPEEKPFYQPNEYYTYIANKDTPFERKVIKFEERKQNSFPSKRGLYVAEILLLEYCSYGDYPKPSKGYPGFWWFEYGIRNIGQALKSLQKRGFIEFASDKLMLKNLKLTQLKDLLRKENCSTTGNKDELVKRVLENIPKEKYNNLITHIKYTLTPLGKDELQDNEYIPYMHKHPYKTIETEDSSSSFTVWDVNLLLAKEGKQKDWKNIVGEIEQQRIGVNMIQSKSNVHEERNSDIYKFLKTNENEILRRSKSSGDGYDEASKGYAYKKAGNDKEALIEFFIAMKKGFDAPAVYIQAAILLRKYKLYDIEMKVINIGKLNIPDGNAHKADLLKRIPTVEKLIKK